MKFIVFLSVFVIIINNVNGYTQPITGDSEISKLNPETRSNENEIVRVHHHHPGRKERCFFSSPSSSGNTPSLPSWDGMIPRIQTGYTTQGHGAGQQGRYTTPVLPMGAYYM